MTILLYIYALKQRVNSAIWYPARLAVYSNWYPEVVAFHLWRVTGEITILICGTSVW